MNSGLKSPQSPWRDVFASAWTQRWPLCSCPPDWTRRSLFWAIWDYLFSLSRQWSSRSCLLEGETKHHLHPERRWDCARGDPVTLPSVLPCPLQCCWEGTMSPSPVLTLKNCWCCVTACIHPHQPAQSLLPPKCIILTCSDAAFQGKGTQFLQAAGNCSAVKPAGRSGGKARLPAGCWSGPSCSPWQSQHQTLPPARETPGNLHLPPAAATSPELPASCHAAWLLFASSRGVPGKRMRSGLFLFSPRPFIYSPLLRTSSSSSVRPGNSDSRIRETL